MKPEVGTTRSADEPTADVTTPPAGTAETPTAETPTADAPNTEAPAEEPQVAQDHGTQKLSIAELEELLAEIGVEDSELFAGRPVVSRTEGDQPVIMLIGPEDFKRGEIAEFDIEAFGELREQMSSAGFDEAREDDQWQVLQGTLDGHSVFATSGDPRWDDEPAGVAERALGEPADFDRDHSKRSWVKLALRIVPSSRASLCSHGPMKAKVSSC